MICYATALGLFILWVLTIAVYKCKIDIGKQKPKEQVENNKSKNNKTTTDLVQTISAGETKSIAVKKNIKYSTPPTEDLIPEDELIINPIAMMSNDVDFEITEELIQHQIRKRVRAAQTRRHREF